MRRKAFVLHDLGGIGKTQLAVEFARRYQRTFTSASFWLDGSTHDSIRQSIAGIITLLPETQISEASRKYKGAAEELHMVIVEVLRWFDILENNRWLLVIDNVDRAYPFADRDPEAFNVEKYFPDADQTFDAVQGRFPPQREANSSLPTAPAEPAAGPAAVKPEALRKRNTRDQGQSR